MCSKYIAMASFFRQFYKKTSYKSTFIKEAPSTARKCTHIFESLFYSYYMNELFSKLTK